MTYFFSTTTKTSDANVWLASVEAVHAACFQTASLFQHKLCTVFGVTGVVGSVRLAPRLQLPEALEDRIRNCVEAAEAFEYCKNGGTKRRIVYWCSLRHRQREPGSDGSVDDPNFRRRPCHRKSKQCFPCQGSAVINLSRALLLTVSIRHEFIHEAPVKRQVIDDAARHRIRSLFDIGCPPHQILSILRAERKVPYKYGDFWNAWNETCAASYKFAEDPCTSAILAAKNNTNMTLIHEHQNPDGFGFIVRPDQDFVLTYSVKELFVDSTYKTNGQEMEVFAVLGTILGTGFPVAYFFLSSASHATYQQRKHSVLQFFRNLRQRCANLNPSFFFTDKDFAQIQAIKETFGIVPSLCLWHMKRAIKKKISSLQKHDMKHFSAANEKALLSVIDRHYHAHPLIDQQHSAEQLEELAISEIRDMLSHPSNRPLLSYLEENWYEKDLYALWGRRHSHMIALSKTTMYAEGHWSLMKRGALQNYNRPRADLLVYLIDRIVLPKLGADFTNLLNGNTKPLWWNDFIKE